MHASIARSQLSCREERHDERIFQKPAMKQLSAFVLCTLKGISVFMRHAI